MQRELLIDALKQMGFRISKAGRLIGKEGMDYGVIRDNDIQLMDRSIVDFSCVSVENGMEFNEGEQEIIFHYPDGTQKHILGEYVSEADEAALEQSKIPTITSELMDIFEILYPNARDCLYYDSLNEREMVNDTMFGGDVGLRARNDTIDAMYHDDLERRFKDNNFAGKLPSLQVRDEVLKLQIHKRERNLFREWVESHEWDGVPRLRTWFRDTFGATAPPLVSNQALEEKIKKKDKAWAKTGETLEERYIGDVSEAWFVGAVKRMYSKTKHDIVPVLIGEQGIGKGMAIRYTAGHDEWYIDTNVDVKDPNRFLDSIRGRVIVELSESTQLRSGDADSLKAFISKTEDQLRKPYERNTDSYPRHFVFIASSNLDNVFTDITGNRRYFPMYCNPKLATRRFGANRDFGIGQYDVEQVWAEALALFRSGKGKWWMTDVSAEIAEVVQSYGTQDNSNLTVIDDYLDDPAHGYADVGARISKDIIFSEVFCIDPSRAIPKDIENSYRAWANSRMNWRKIDKVTRIGGKACRGYERYLAPGERKEIGRLGIVNDPDEVKNEEKGDTMSSQNVLDNLMRERSVKYGFLSTGDEFPSEDLDEDTIQALFDGGYIYEDYRDSKRILKVGYLP